MRCSTLRASFSQFSTANMQRIGITNCLHAQLCAATSKDSIAPTQPKISEIRRQLGCKKSSFMEFIFVPAPLTAARYFVNDCPGLGRCEVSRLNEEPLCISLHQSVDEQLSEPSKRWPTGPSGAFSPAPSCSPVPITPQQQHRPCPCPTPSSSSAHHLDPAPPPPSPCSRCPSGAPPWQDTP